MVKLLFPALILLTVPAFSQSDPCNNFTCKMELARKALKTGKYKPALDLAREAEYFDPAKRAEVNAFIDDIFAAIEGRRVVAVVQRKKAETAARRATSEVEKARIEKMRADSAEQASKRIADSLAVAKKRTDTALARAERLARNIDFNGETATWIFRQGFFAAINTGGETLTEFIYESPEPFTGGRAWAKVENQYVLVDDNGKEVSGRYDYRFSLGNRKGYFAGKKHTNYLLDSTGRQIFEIRLPGEIAAISGERPNTNPKPKNYLMTCSDGQYGFIDATGYKRIIKPKYQQSGYFNEGLAPVKLFGYWGAIDTIGRIVIDPVYQSMGNFSEGLAFIRDSIKGAGYINGDGRMVISMPLSEKSVIAEAHSFSDGLALIRETDLRRAKDEFYYIDQTGKKTIQIRNNPYFATSFSDGTAIVFDREGVGLLNRRGKIKRLPDVDYLTGFSEGIAGFQRRSKWGFMNKEGQVVCDPVYDELKEMSDGFAFAKKEGGWLPLNLAGKELVYRFTTSLKDFENGAAMAQAHRKPGLSYKKGDAVAGFILDESVDNENGNPDKSNGWKPYKKSGKYGFKDQHGKVAIPAKYEEVGKPSEGLIPVRVKENTWGYINEQDSMVIPPVYSAAESFINGAAVVSENNDMGYLIDPQGRFIISPDSGISVSRRLNRDIFIVSRHRAGAVGIYDKKGHEVLPVAYQEIKPVGNGFAELKRKGKTGLADSTGAPILPCEYDLIHPVAQRICITEQNNRYGLFAPDQDIFLPCKFEQFGFVREENGWIRVRQNGKWGWVDNTGKTMIPFRYDAATPLRNGKARVMQAPYAGAFTINSKGEMLLRE